MGDVEAVDPEMFNPLICDANAFPMLLASLSKNSILAGCVINITTSAMPNVKTAEDGPMDKYLLFVLEKFGDSSFVCCKLT